MPDAVAITGLGLVLPHGVGIESAQAVFEGRSAVRRLPPACGLPDVGGAPLIRFTPPAGTAACDRAVQFAVTAALEAWQRAGLGLSDSPAPQRIATVISLSKGGVHALALRAGLAAASPGQAGQGGEAAPPLSGATADAAARAVAARLGTAGPVASPVTACASGGHALAWGAAMIRRGVADVALVGAAEASLHPIILGSYRRMGVLAPPGDDPAASVRPFSATRRGFAIGEGAGVLVLESAASARQRNVRPLAWVRGWASGGQATGLAEMEPGGETLARLIGDALRRGGLAPDDVDFVHAHGTATAVNDLAEARAIRAALGPAARRVSVASTKGTHGHLLGAAAAVELVLTVLAMQRGAVPPTANLTDPDPEIGLDCTPLVPRGRDIRCALKIASGFGGHMIAVALAAER